MRAVLSLINWLIVYCFSLIRRMTGTREVCPVFKRSRAIRALPTRRHLRRSSVSFRRRMRTPSHWWSTAAEAAAWVKTNRSQNRRTAIHAPWETRRISRRRSAPRLQLVSVFIKTKKKSLFKKLFHLKKSIESNSIKMRCEFDKKLNHGNFACTDCGKWLGSGWRRRRRHARTKRPAFRLLRRRRIGGRIPAQDRRNCRR